MKTSGETIAASQKSRRLMRCVPPQTLAIVDMGISLRLGLGYFYPRGSVGPVCLVEAALEFLAMYTRQVTENVGLKPRVHLSTVKFMGDCSIFPKDLKWFSLLRRLGSP